MNFKFNERGFTFVEIIVVVMLILLILIPMYSLLDFGIRSFQKMEQIVDQQQNLRIAMEAITQDLKKSRGIVGRVFSTRTDEKNLLLKTREGDTIWYYLSGQTLRWAKMGKGTSTFYGHNPVADGILSLNFSYNKLPIEESDQVTVFIRGTDKFGNILEYRTIIQLNLN